MQSRLTDDPRLLRDGGLQPQADTSPTRAAPKETLQALGTDLAEGNVVGPEAG